MFLCVCVLLQLLDVGLENYVFVYIAAHNSRRVIKVVRRNIVVIVFRFRIRRVKRAGTNINDNNTNNTNTNTKMALTLAVVG